MNYFNIPANIKTFFFDYEISTFLECNKELALKNQNQNYFHNEKKNEMVSSVMIYITQSLESLYKHYWLAGGTLLGNY